MERLGNSNLLNRSARQRKPGGPGDVEPEDLDILDHNSPRPEPPVPQSTGSDDGDKLG